MHYSHSSLLLIFVKHPEKGKSKTRLAKGIGDNKALEVYRKLLMHTRDTALETPVDKAIFFGNPMPEQDLWSEVKLPRFQQVGIDLGARMKHAFAWGFSQAYHKICIIGSDCATLTSEILTDAFKALDSHDFVIGPAKDGGYYLLGMSSLFTKVFEEKIWSTAKVREEAVADLNEAGKSYFLLQELSDIDVLEDLQGTFLEAYIPQFPDSEKQ